MQPQIIPLQILSKKLIKPATPTPHNLRKFKISSLDQIRPPIYVPYIFFYLAKDNDERAKFEERSKQLQISLSELLTLFYPLAGRYNKDDLLIDCNDHGIEYVEARVASRLAPVILHRDLHSRFQLHHLVPCQSESPRSPLVAVQCNMFECGGIVIGTCISHRIVDAFVYTKFIDGWATACRVGIDKVDRPSFGLASLLPPREMISEVKPAFPVCPDLKFTSKTFVFSGLAISNLRKIAKGGGDEDSGKLARQPSRVLLVTALIWKALIGVEQAKYGQLRPSIITHMINMRGRTVLPISDDCCGNFARPVLVLFTPNKRSDGVEFQELLGLACDAITNAVADCAKPQNGNELFLMVNKAWKDDAQVQSYFFTSTCRMPFYPDFGWGKPNRVIRLKGRSDITIVLMDTREGDGIEAWIRLVENDMNLFQQDPDIRAFTCQVEQSDDNSNYLRSRY